MISKLSHSTSLTTGNFHLFVAAIPRQISCKQLHFYGHTICYVNIGSFCSLLTLQEGYQIRPECAVLPLKVKYYNDIYNNIQFTIYTVIYHSSKKPNLPHLYYIDWGLFKQITRKYWQWMELCCIIRQNLKYM